MTIDNQPPELDIRRYLAMLRRHKLILVAALGLSIAAALVLTAQQTKLFTSSARVLVKPTGVVNYIYRPDVIDVKTEAGVAASEVVAAVVKSDLDSPESLQALLSGLKVQAGTDTDFLDFEYTDADPATARQLSSAFSQAYLSDREARTQEQLQQQREPLENELKDLEGDMPRLIKQIQGTRDAGALATLNQQLSYAEGRLGYLRQQILPFEQALTDGGDVVAEANLPSTPSSPNLKVNLALALLVGLGIGIAAAFVRERLDDRIRGAKELESAIGAPILATIPKVDDWKVRSKTVMSSSLAPSGIVAEAYRTLRTNLQFIARDEGFKVLAITSSTAGEGKTTTTSNLAHTLAQTGQRVVAVSCDLRKPRLHTFYGLPNKSGLSNILRGDATIAEASQKWSQAPSMRIIASGPVPSDPAELLGSREMVAFLDNLRKVADFVLLDCPPVLAVSDAMVLAPMCDGVVIVSDAQATSRGAATHTREQLLQVGANIVGAVLNNFDRSQAVYYPYENTYYYSSYDYHDRGSKRRGPENGRDSGAMTPPSPTPPEESWR